MIGSNMSMSNNDVSEENIIREHTDCPDKNNLFNSHITYSTLHTVRILSE